MRLGAIAVLALTACAASAVSALPPRPPTMFDLIAKCAVEYPPAPPVDACAAARSIAQTRALDLGATFDELDHDCDAGDAAACAWLGWNEEAHASDADRRAHAHALFEEAALKSTFDLGACEGRASRECSGIESGMSCCDRGIRACAAGCESVCDAARAALRSRTLDVLDASCASGRALACHVAGMLYAYGGAEEDVGIVVEQDGARARERFRRGCDLGLGIACVQAAQETDDEALEKRACDRGAAAGCHALAAHQARRRDATAARTSEQRACALGMPLVCDDLAR
jgi:hypothetical protein